MDTDKNIDIHLDILEAIQKKLEDRNSIPTAEKVVAIYKEICIEKRIAERRSTDTIELATENQRKYLKDLDCPPSIWNRANLTRAEASEQIDLKKKRKK